MEVFVKVSKERVYDEVAKLTSYIGSKIVIDGQPLYNKVFTTPEDAELLDRFWIASVEELVDTTRHFFSLRFEEADGIACIVVDLPKDFDLNKERSLSTKAEEFCINRILTEWLTISVPDQVELYATKAQSALAIFKSALHSRRIPQRI